MIKNGLCKRNDGFTLVELMIVLAVVVILFSIAVPGYNNHVIQTRQTDAQSALLGLASAMEQYRLRTGSYLDAASNINYPLQAPVDGGTAHYDLQIIAATVSYELQAVPLSSSPQAGTQTFVLQSTGERNWD